MCFRFLIIAFILVMLPGCATWSTANISNAGEDKIIGISTVSPEQIEITESDITDRPYITLGDISVTVNKTTAFHANPTREMVNLKLQEEAAKLGAEAVVLVRYGKGGVSLLSWGSLEGKGRAVRFAR